MSSRNPSKNSRLGRKREKKLNFGTHTHVPLHFLIARSSLSFVFLHQRNTITLLTFTKSTGAIIISFDVSSRNSELMHSWGVCFKERRVRKENRIYQLNPKKIYFKSLSVGGNQSLAHGNAYFNREICLCECKSCTLFYTLS